MVEIERADSKTALPTKRVKPVVVRGREVENQSFG